MTRIFAFGSNGSGQLGIGHLEDVSLPEECIFAPHGDHESDNGLPSRKKHRNKVKRIVAGGNHTVILFESGAAYAAGSNDSGKCGQYTEGIDNEAESTAYRPCASPLLRFQLIVLRVGGKVIDRFAAISATWDATILVASSTQDGSDGINGGEVQDEVYVLGSGPKGELGIGERHVDTSTGPMKTQNFPPSGQRITSISSGMGHTVTILSDGSVYGWGASRKGQLGDSATKSKYIWRPQKISDINFHAESVACGREFTLITGHRNGKSAYSILGTDRWNLVSGAPETISGPQIASSWHGIYVHEKNQSITAWGRNDRGQLPPANLTAILKIAPGSEHVVVLTVDLKVAAFGWGEHGNCGPQTDVQGNVKETGNEIPLHLKDDTRIVDVGAGCATSFIVTSNIGG